VTARALIGAAAVGLALLAGLLAGLPAVAATMLATGQGPTDCVGPGPADGCLVGTSVTQRATTG
jgi:hypothetical protein